VTSTISLAVASPIGYVRNVLQWNVSFGDGGGETDITDALNAQMAPNYDDGVYTGGKGMIIRNPLDGLEFDDSLTVVPTTFWVNDIYAPSQIYPSSGGGGKWAPWCPNGGTDGVQDISWFCDCSAIDDSGYQGPWNYAQLAYVVSSAMPAVFTAYDDIQGDDWGWGVFYPTDSNSVDHRCRNLGDEELFDCPGGYIPYGGDFVPDAGYGGAGVYPAGNPYCNPDFGGGAGCHFQTGAAIDQMDAYDDYDRNLVQDADCQCNYDLKGGYMPWDDWVYNWINHAQPKPGFESYNWFSYQKAPSWGLDVSMCWVNNPRDMINMQNSIYWHRLEWSNQLIPASDWNDDPASLRHYWGWNEVPMPKDTITLPRNWDCIMIKIPAAIGGGDGTYDSVWDMHDAAQYQLGLDLLQWTNTGFLVPGLDNIGNRPGSYVVFAREWVDEYLNWQRFFYCEYFAAAGMKVIFEAPGGDFENGACYLDYDADFYASKNLTLGTNPFSK